MKSTHQQFVSQSQCTGRTIVYSLIQLMEELNEELAALVDIFAENEYEVLRNGDIIDVSFPLPFRLELQFNIRIIKSSMYDVIGIRVVEFEGPLLDLVLRAASNARSAALDFLESREKGEHRHLYSAHQRALGAFNQCISSDTSSPMSTKYVTTSSEKELSVVPPEPKHVTKSTKTAKTTSKYIINLCNRIKTHLNNCICCTL